MELDLTTFILEIVNFLVLVWLLHRFLYRPVLGILDQRRAAIRQQLADAAEQRREADALREELEGRKAALAAEREDARAKLNAEIDRERKQALASLNEELGQQREKYRANMARHTEEARTEAQAEALELAGQFVARLLGRVADPAVEQRLVALAVAELAALPEDRLRTLRQHLPQAAEATVTSAYELPEDQRQALRQALATLAEHEVACHFETDESLVAGVRITAGHWRLAASLADELAFFQELPHDGQDGAHAG